MSDHTAELPELRPEAENRSRWGLLPVVASVVAVALIAGGGLAAWRFFASGGSRPADVLPSSTFALVTVDLDPSGGQKIQAIKTLRKLPSWRKRTGITTDSDLVKVLFEKTLGKGPCKSVDYDRDVKPWLGSRAGLGGVLLDGDAKPVPVLALQVKDAAKARTGFAALARCSKADADGEFGWTISKDYILASDSTAHAKSIVSEAAKSPLAESADFHKWTDQVGGEGIVNAYLGRASIKVLSRTLGSDLGSLGSGGRGRDNKTQEDQLAEAFKDFKGAAAVLRFADGGMELSVAGGGAAQARSNKLGDHVESLPKDTTAVLAVSVPKASLVKLTNSDLGSKGDTSSLGGILRDSTGLDLPDDLITLLGSSLSISLGGDAPADLEKVSGPADLSLGLLVHGDEKGIEKVITKVEARTGVRLEDLPAALATSHGKVAIASRPEYAGQLLENGSLGDSRDFKDVVSHASDATSVLYVSLDNKWTDALRKAAVDTGDKDAVEAADNFSVLRAFGASVWTEGDTGHGLIRLALK